jgi:hypothetical protein
MATSIKTFNSEGGFGVNQKTIIDEDFNLINANTIEVKNSNYNDLNKTDYILKGLNSTVLTLDGLQPITLQSNTINFITANIIAVNSIGDGHYSEKIESHVTCNSSGDVQVLSELTTIIKDSIPTGQTWTILSYDSGTANQFSYVSSRGGTTDTIKWMAYVQVSSALWT